MTQTPVSTLQPALALTEFVDTTGVFPPRGGAGSGPFLGSIGIFAGSSFLFDTPANGQTDSIQNNTALFSILGTSFGGNGTSNFQLPNLGGIETIGAGQGAGLPLVGLGQTLGQTTYDLTTAQLPPSLGGASAAIDTQQPSLGLNYVINTEGVFPSGNLTLNSLGVVSAFAGNFTPGDELFCDGQLLPISEYSALFNLIGTTYGGDGVTTFALPDLQGRDIVGAGDGFTLGEQVGATNVTLSDANSPLGPEAPVATQQPGLVMNYYIALSGIFPSEGETGNSSQQTPYLGQIVASAENISDPAGWALCDGQLLSIAQNQALFSVLGTTYGGDGVTTFALPNLQGRTVLGTGGVNGLGTLGQVSGATTITLTSANLPALAAPTIALADDTGAPDAPGHTTDGLVNVSGIATGAAWSYSTDSGTTFTSGIGTSFTLTGDGVKNVLVNQSWGPGDASPNASLTFTLDPEILWQNASGQAATWEMSGPNIIGGGPVTPNPGPSWRAVGTGDFNGDGLSDILWQNTNTGQASIWEMNGNTIESGGPVTPNPGPDWKAIGTGDFNDDGHSDILWQNTNTGQVSIWEMDGNTQIGGGAVTPNPGPAWEAIGTGDFNQDGFSDILLQNKNTGQVSVWEMNGNTLIGGGPVANPGTSWHAIGTGAGGSDILLQNTSGQATIWEMNGNTIAGGGPVSPNPGSSWRAVGLT
jgi:microcystin-dependent protein